MHMLWLHRLEALQDPRLTASGQNQGFQNAAGDGHFVRALLASYQSLHFNYCV